MASNMFTTLIFLTLLLNTVRSLSASPYDFFDTAESLLNDLRSTTNLHSTDALSTLTLLSMSSESLANANLINAEVSVNEAIENIDSTIEHLRQEVENSNGNIPQLDNCIKLYSPQIETLPTIVLNNVGECVNTNMDLIADIIDNSIEQIGTISKVVDNLAIEIQLCKLDPNDSTTCILGIITEISIELVNLPAVIKEEVDRSEAIVNSLTPLYTPCVTDKVPIAHIIGGQIVEYIQTCLNRAL